MPRRHQNNGDRRYAGHLGGELRRLIERKGVSHTWLGDRIGKNHSTVSGWVRGRSLPADDEDFDRIARWLGANADDLRDLADRDEAEFLASKMPTNPGPQPPGDYVSVESVRRALLELGGMPEDEVRNIINSARRKSDGTNPASGGLAASSMPNSEPGGATENSADSDQ